MSSNNEYAEFTTYNNSNPVVCQRCLRSFLPGTVLYFMQDYNKPDGIHCETRGVGELHTKGRDLKKIMDNIVNVKNNIFQLNEITMFTEDI